MPAVVPRYSQWAPGAVLAIAVSGGFTAWRQVGSLSAVTNTPYGRLLLVKTIIFAVLVAAASRSRRLAPGGLAVPLGLSRAPVTTGNGTGAGRGSGTEDPAPALLPAAGPAGAAAADDGALAAAATPAAPSLPTEPSP